MHDILPPPPLPSLLLLLLLLLLLYPQAGHSAHVSRGSWA
jgi:hypothetical protein